MLTSKTLSVSAINNGTVIDHINSNCAISILRLLHLSTNHTKITIGINLPSQSSGYKDVIKFEDKYLSNEELIKISIIAPMATVNVITNYEVSEKYKVSPPNSITNIFKCPNQCCITNHEPMHTHFHLHYFRQETTIQCHYCRQKFKYSDIHAFINEPTSLS